MVGGSSARWGVWGTSLDIAKHIQTGSAPNAIRVSNAIQDAGNICQILYLPIKWRIKSDIIVFYTEL